MASDRLAPTILTDKEMFGISDYTKSLFASTENFGNITGDWLQLEKSTFNDLKNRGKIRKEISFENLIQSPDEYDEVAKAYIDDLKTTFKLPDDETAALWSYRPGWYKKYGGKIENIPNEAKGSFGKSGKVIMQQRMDTLNEHLKSIGKEQKFDIGMFNPLRISTAEASEAPDILTDEQMGFKPPDILSDKEIDAPDRRFGGVGGGWMPETRFEKAIRTVEPYMPTIGKLFKFQKEYIEPAFKVAVRKPETFAGKALTPEELKETEQMRWADILREASGMMRRMVPGETPPDYVTELQTPHGLRIAKEFVAEMGGTALEEGIKPTTWITWAVLERAIPAIAKGAFKKLPKSIQQALIKERYLFRKSPIDLAYKELGLKMGASLQDVTKAYRGQAVKWHPDKAPAGQAIKYTRKFIRIQGAYDKIKGQLEVPTYMAEAIKKPTIEAKPEAKAIIPIEETPTQKVISALKIAKSVRGKQERLYTEERAKRIARAKAVGEKVKGERGFYAELAQLKGKLPRAQFEAIRDKIGQEDIDNLFNMVKENSLLNEWQKINTRTGLAKLFGEYGGVVPTEGELTLLKRVFGEDFVKAILDKRGMWKKIKEAGYQVANIPRSVMASFDYSAPFRQGVFFIGRGKQFWPAFGKMFKPFFSEKAFKAIQEDIVRRPTFELMDRSRLALTKMGEMLTQREEPFMSMWAEKIPGVGPIVRASGRAYIGFLNKLRADVFDDLVKKATALGLDPKRNMDLTRAIAKFVNAGTGRGSLGGLERAAVGLNTFFFSPRLMASRLSLLNPVFYIRQPPFVRKEALKSLFTFASTVLTILGLAKLAGIKVGADPRSADFGKMIIGNTRIDILGGFQQYLRMAGQLISGEYVSSTTGKIVTLGEGYRPLTRADIVRRQIESKFSPIMSFANSLLKGKTFAGKDISVPKEVGLRFVPMVIQDAYDIMEDDPSLLPAGGLAIFGVGVQTYKGKEMRPIERWREKRKTTKSNLEKWRKKRKMEKR